MSRQMKDSGLEWIGEIPQEWKLNKISYIYDDRNDKVSDKDYPPLSVTKQGIVPQLDTAAKTDNGDNRKLIKINDFVINSRSDRRGSCGISEYQGSCSLINTVLKPRKNMCNEYYNFVFKSDMFADEFYKWGNGIVDDLWSTKWSSMKNIYIPSPNYKEQKRIADFLDSKCSKIDDTIEKENKVIEKLKEYKQSIITEAVTKGLDKNVPIKDSGIGWIGDIPQDWSIKKGKYILKLHKRKCNEDDEVITCFRDGQVTLRSKRREDGFTFADKEIGYQGIKKGDLVIHGMDGFAGAIGISDSNGKGSPVLNVCTGTEDVFLDYIRLYLKTLASQNVFLALATGIRERSCDLRWNKIANLLFVIPPLSEQQQIANYLDNKCSAIDKTIEKKQQLIEKLTEYKKSLIYEAVTGKIEV